MQVNTVCGPVPSKTEQRILWHCADIKTGNMTACYARQFHQGD